MKKQVSNQLNYVDFIKDFNMGITKPGIYGILSATKRIANDYYQAIVTTNTSNDLSYIQDIQGFITVSDISWLLTNTRFNIHQFSSLCREFNLALNQPINKMSKGQQNLVNFCFTCSIQAKYYLFDEVFSHLDAVSIKHVKRVINKLYEEGATILISSNFIEELETLITHYILLQDYLTVTIHPIDDLNYLIVNDVKEDALASKQILGKVVYLHKSMQQINQINLKDYYEFIFSMD